MWLDSGPESGELAWAGRENAPLKFQSPVRLRRGGDGEAGEKSPLDWVTGLLNEIPGYRVRVVPLTADPLPMNRNRVFFKGSRCAGFTADQWHTVGGLAVLCRGGVC